MMADALWYLIAALVLTLLLLIVGGPIYIFFNQRRLFRKKFEATFRGRQPLDASEFYKKYFQQKGVPPELVTRVRKILEEELGSDLSRLDSADDFTRNLGFFFDHDSLVDVEIILRLEDEFGISISDDEARETNTIEQIVDLIYRKTGTAD